MAGWHAGQGKYSYTNLTDEQIYSLSIGASAVYNKKLKTTGAFDQKYMVDAVDINWKGIQVDGQDVISSGHLTYILSNKIDNNAISGFGDGIPLLDKTIIDESTLKGNLPDKYVTIPTAEELYTEPTTTRWTDTNANMYLDVLFNSLRALQSEVAKLKNSFKYGIYSMCDTDTAMSSVVNELTNSEVEEPLWATEETDLSEIYSGVTFQNDCTAFDPLENCTLGNSYWGFSGGVKWTDFENNTFRANTDPKQYLFITASGTDIKINLEQVLDEESEEEPETLTIDLNKLNIVNTSSKKYNILFIVNRSPEDDEDYNCKNFIWLQIADYTTGVSSHEGYWVNNKLYTSLHSLGDQTQKFFIESVEFGDINLYKFNTYTKYQDFSNNVLPSPATEDDYKYKVAHLTIRSVETKDVLDDIKDQLPSNEMVYVEDTNRLYIKTRSGKIRPLLGSSSGTDDTDDTNTGMTQEEIITWLAANGIIVTADGNGEADITLAPISDITFIHQGSGKKFKFETNSDGELKGKEIVDDSLTLNTRLTSAINKKTTATLSNIFNETPALTYFGMRGFVGTLGAIENYTSTATVDGDISSDIGLSADRIKIGAVYAPSSSIALNACTHAYVELENTSDKDFYLDNCYLHFATKKNGTVKTYHLALEGYIPAGGTYLVRGKQYANPNDANVYINVATYDQEWWITNDSEEKELIDLTIGDQNTFLLTYGLSNISYETVLVSDNHQVDGVNHLGYSIYYIDSISIGAHILSSKSGSTWIYKSNKAYAIGTADCIYKNMFELDPAKQAFAGLAAKTDGTKVYDSSRYRNANLNDMQTLLINNEYISFPKTSEICNVSKFTPKASFEGKNVCTDKTQLDIEKPNMVTCSFGKDMNTTRCFNWVSGGLFNEYLWIRKQGETKWTRFESYNSSTDDSDSSTVYTKKKFGYFFNNTTNKVATIESVIYDRITSTFPGANTPYTSHKLVLTIPAVEDGTQVYEYVVGRKLNDGTPDENHTSDIQTFTMYPKAWPIKIYQTTDQQGFHWIEYQYWAACAEKINERIEFDKTHKLLEGEPTVGNVYYTIDNKPVTITSDNKSTYYNNNNTLISLYTMESNNFVPVLMNTGDMTQNGTRVNEWLDYYNGGKVLFNHMEQMNVVGNNDLCNSDPTILGTGDDEGKSNSYFFHVFYCYDTDYHTQYFTIGEDNATFTPVSKDNEEDLKTNKYYIYDSSSNTYKHIIYWENQNEEIDGLTTNIYNKVITKYTYTFTKRVVTSASGMAVNSDTTLVVDNNELCIKNSDDSLSRITDADGNNIKVTLKENTTEYLDVTIDNKVKTGVTAITPNYSDSTADNYISVKLSEVNSIFDTTKITKNIPTSTVSIVKKDTDGNITDSYSIIATEVISITKENVEKIAENVYYSYNIQKTSSENGTLYIISNSNATKYVPSLYHFGNGTYEIVCINSEFTPATCKNWFKQTITYLDGTTEVTNPINVYTGWEINSDSAKAHFDNSFTTIYTMVYNMLNEIINTKNISTNNIITACHEMPFTVLTAENVLTNTRSKDRSLNGKSLVGCHCNKMSNLDTKSNYWLSRLLEYFNIKLMIGGHKHTYMCTNPLRELYKYTVNSAVCDSLNNGPMEMANTLENDTASFSMNLSYYNFTDSKTNKKYRVLSYTYTGEHSDGTGDKVDTSKFPIMDISKDSSRKYTNLYGIECENGNDSATDVIYPYYGVNAENDNYNKVIYFMCQATGFKLKSNKELPTPNQRFSYVIPKTTYKTSGASPSAEQQYAMFAMIDMQNKTVELARFKNITSGTALLSQTVYGTKSTALEFFTHSDIYGVWGTNEVTLLNY